MYAQEGRISSVVAVEVLRLFQRRCLQTMQVDVFLRTQLFAQK